MWMSLTSNGVFFLVLRNRIRHPLNFTINQWIGLRENLQETPISNGKNHGFRLRFSLKPIHWINGWSKTIKLPYYHSAIHGRFEGSQWARHFDRWTNGPGEVHQDDFGQAPLVFYATNLNNQKWWSLCDKTKFNSTHHWFVNMKKNLMVKTWGILIGSYRLLIPCRT